MESLTGRLFKIVDLLQSAQRLTTGELAHRLGVSERTVSRDIGRLQELELPVEVTPGRQGGVSLAPGALLPALRFTDDEVGEADALKRVDKPRQHRNNQTGSEGVDDHSPKDEAETCTLIASHLKLIGTTRHLQRCGERSFSSFCSFHLTPLS